MNRAQICFSDWFEMIGNGSETDFEMAYFLSKLKFDPTCLNSEL